MKTNRICIIIWLLTICTLSIHSQTIELPSFGLTSHETLEINKIVATTKETAIYLSIENRIEGGTFCCDNNVFIIYPDGTRSKLTSSAGIPVCPENYKFKTIGEKLHFTLNFLPLNPGTEWIDLVEECGTNCFWVYGVTLDNELNKKLDEAFLLASDGKPADNILLFKKILDSIDNQNPGIEGLLYTNIINAAAEAADNDNMMVWYKRLVSSQAPRLSNYIKYLNDRGIRY